MKRLLLLVSLLLMSLLAVTAFGATWRIPAKYAGPQDSVWLVIQTQAGGVRDSAKFDASGGDRQYFDTTITVGDDTAYYAVLKNWADGEDSAATWVFFRDALTPYTGEGSDTLHYVCYDSALAVAIQGAAVTCRNSAGSIVAVVGSDGTGVATFTLSNGNDYYFTASNPLGYTWLHDSVISFSSGATDTIFGSNTLSATAVYGWVKDGLGRPLYGATVLAFRDCRTSTSDSAIIWGEPVPVSTDTSGLFTLALITSDSYDNDDCGSYTITATYGGNEVFKVEDLWITSGFNIADSIAARN